MSPHWPIQSLVMDDGLDWLHDQAKYATSVAEVGAWYGGGTYAILTACKGPVYAVDHWCGSPDPDDATHHRSKREPVYEHFMTNVGYFPNLTVLRMASTIAAARFMANAIDLVFIDAGHDPPSVEADIAAWWPVCRGLFCGHDWSHAPVRAAIQRLEQPVDHHPGDIWSIRKASWVRPAWPSVPEDISSGLRARVDILMEGVR